MVDFERFVIHSTGQTAGQPDGNAPPIRHEHHLAPSTLRDYFAGCALASTQWGATRVSECTATDLEDMAGEIFRVADAMLKARGTAHE